jgi:hypothetical protein
MSSSCQKHLTRRRGSGRKRWNRYTRYDWPGESKQQIAKHEGKHDARLAHEETPRHSRTYDAEQKRQQISLYLRCSSPSTNREHRVATDEYPR